MSLWQLIFYQVQHGNLNSFLQLNSLQPLAPTYILINPLLLGAPLLCARLKRSATFSSTHVIFTLLLCVLLTWRFFPVLHFHHPLTEFDHGHADRCILSLDQNNGPSSFGRSTHECLGCFCSTAGKMRLCIIALGLSSHSNIFFHIQFPLDWVHFPAAAILVSSSSVFKPVYNCLLDYYANDLKEQYWLDESSECFY